MTSILRQPLARKAIAALAVKEVIDRVQEARKPRRSFLRRHAGKITLLALAGAGIYVWQQQRSSQGLQSQWGTTPSREPSIEPGERLDAPLRAPEEATESSTQPAPAGR